MGRGEIRPVRPVSYGSDADRQRWSALVSRFSQEMHLVGADPNGLLQFADPLHALTGGRIGALRRVLARAMAAVVDEKPGPDTAEAITGEHIFGAAGVAAVTALPVGDSDGRGRVA